MAEAVTTVIVIEINKETIKVSVRIMIVATKMEMVKETVTMGTAITIVIVTVISKVNSAIIRVEINVTMLPVTIRQDHVLTLKRVQLALKAEQNAEYSRQSETRFREEKAAEQRRCERARKGKKENTRLKSLLKKQLLKLSQLPNQHRLLNQLQLRKHKIHVVKRHVQINHVIIVARMKMDLSKQEIISGIIKTK